MRKDTALVIFYALYFIWLFVLTYLTFESPYLNLFSVVVILFYFIFLREPMDIFWFIVFFVVILFILATNSTLSQINYKIDIEKIMAVPAWLVLSWTTTMIAFRKLLLTVLK